MDLPKYKLIIFDLDGTLADRDTDKLLPGVSEYFESLVSDLPSFAIATNQGGVGLRYWMEKDGSGEPEKYPTESSIGKRISKIERLLSDFGIYPIIYCCYAYITRKGTLAPIPDKDCLLDQWNVNFRKPSPGMLMRAMEYYKLEPFETLMVGDRPEDEEAAKRAGCDFMWAWEFFGREKPEGE